MKYFKFRKSNGEYYSKITTARGVFNYFIKLKDVAIMYIREDFEDTAIIGYYNIYNYLVRNNK